MRYRHLSLTYLLMICVHCEATRGISLRFGLAIDSFKLGATENTRPRLDRIGKVDCKIVNFCIAFNFMSKVCLFSMYFTILSMNIVNFAGLGTFTQLGLCPYPNK